MSLRKYVLISILVFLLFCALAFNKALCLEVASEYAAIVNGEEIPLERYTRAVEAAKKDLLEQRQVLTTLESPASLEAMDEKIIEIAVLDQLIDSILVSQGIEKEGIIVTEVDIREKIEELKKGFPSPQQFHRSVAGQKMTIEDLKISIKRQLTVDKIKEKLKENILVLDEEIEEFYDRNVDIFVQKEKVNLRHIFVSSMEGAEAVLKRLNAGDDFASIAKEVSLDLVTKDLGGDMGFVEKDEIDGALAEIAFILKPGHVSPIIETDYGFHIVKVEDRISSKRTTVSKARKSIERFLLDEKAATAFQKWLDDQRFDADIKINEQLKPLYR